MKNLLDALDKSVERKNYIISIKNSYTCTVKVQYENNVTSYETNNNTIRFHHSEIPTNWWLSNNKFMPLSNFGFGIMDTPEDVLDKYFFFDHRKSEEIKQKIIEKTGVTNVEVPSQSIIVYNRIKGYPIRVGTDCFEGISTHGKITIYQLDENGNSGYLGGHYHPNVENLDVTGSVRIFYRIKKEIKRVEFCYRDESRFDSQKYENDLFAADKNILDRQNDINNLMLDTRKRLEQIELSINTINNSIYI